MPATKDPGGDLQERMARALTQSEERFRLVVEWAPYAMIMVSDCGLIEMVNAQAERIFGYNRGDMLNKPVEMLLPLRFRAAHPGLRSLYCAEPHSRPAGAGRDLYALKQDGREFPVEIGLNPLNTDAGLKVLSSIVDITERKQREDSIRSALQEKNILLGEIHHRVKNNLQIVHSLLGLQSHKVIDPDVLTLMRETQNRIRSMGLIHQTLCESNDFARVDFRSFLDALLPVLISAYARGSERIDLEVEMNEVKLPINAAIPCGLIVNELVSNALKYAYPAQSCGVISIRLAYETSERLVLSVSDFGVGIPDSVDLAQTDTLGLQLITLLADQLGAQLAVRRAHPTRFELRFVPEPGQ